MVVLAIADLVRGGQGIKRTGRAGPRSYTNNLMQQIAFGEKMDAIGASRCARPI